MNQASAKSKDGAPSTVDFCGAERRNATMRSIATGCLCPLIAGLLVSACASNGERIDGLARAANLTRAEFEADGLRTLIYIKSNGPSADRLNVFLEGDGLPWRDGIVPSVDPTTAHPLALQLLIRTPGTGVYVSRPCYQRLQGERCSAELWTNARYSEEVVSAMTATVREAAAVTNTREILLVGHSGGGTLAILIAERLDNVSAVVTIAANLDIQVWAQHQGYLPLERSLNPAASDRDHRWAEIHLMGAEDTVVPFTTTAAYFVRYPDAQRWRLAEHGHVCCWLQAWDSLWKRIEAELSE